MKIFIRLLAASVIIATLAVAYKASARDIDQCIIECEIGGGDFDMCIAVCGG